jgi:hypothetical protein
MSTPTVDSCKEYTVNLSFFLKEDPEEVSVGEPTWADMMEDRRLVKDLNSGPHQAGVISTIVSNRHTGTWKSLIFQERAPGTEATDSQVKPETVISLMRQLSARERLIVTRAVTDSTVIPVGNTGQTRTIARSALGASQSCASVPAKKGKKPPPAPVGIPKTQEEKEACKLQTVLIAKRKAFLESVNVPTNIEKRDPDKMSTLSEDVLCAIRTHDKEVSDAAEKCLQLRQMRRKEAAEAASSTVCPQRTTRSTATTSRSGRARPGVSGAGCSSARSGSGD